MRGARFPRGSVPGRGRGWEWTATSAGQLSGRPTPNHRINIAVTLGDASTAIDVAHGIDLSSIALTERRVTLLIDTARTFLQWGKHEKAYLALRAAEQTAPEEIAGRPSAHRLVRELVTTAPPTVRRDAEAFARQLGVPR